MSKIVLSTQPLKIVQKTGFPRQSHKKVYEQHETAVGVMKGAKLGTQTTTQKVPGAAYYVFECPACGKRNKRAMKTASYTTESRIAFGCNGCGRTVEMERSEPISSASSESRIILP